MMLGANSQGICKGRASVNDGLGGLVAEYVPSQRVPLDDLDEWLEHAVLMHVGQWLSRCCN